MRHTAERMVGSMDIFYAHRARAVLHNKAMRCAGFLFVIAVSAFAQSGSVHNAAGVSTWTSIRTPFLPNSRISFESFLIGPFGSVFTISSSSADSQLAPGSLAVINYYSGTPTPARVNLTASVSLRPVGSTMPISAQVVAADASTITFVIPPQMPTGAAQLIYHADGDTTKWTQVEIAPASFALFGTLPYGPLQAQVISNDGKVTLSGLSNPAMDGGTVVLWGSGLGSTAESDIAVSLGGVQQTVLYAGKAPNVPGVDQINFRTAASTPDGCYVPLTVRYGQSSITSFLSKSKDGSACAHPFGLSAADLKKLDAGGTVAVAQIKISSGLTIASAEHVSRQDSATVSQGDWSAATMAGYFAPLAQTGCSLAATQGAYVATPLDVPVVINGVLVGLGLGQQTITNGTANLVLTNDNGFSAMVNSGDTAVTALPPPLFAAGKWTWKSEGNDVLLPSTFTFNLLAPILLNGSAPISLKRDTNQTIAWNPAGYTADSAVTLTISGRGPSAASPLLSCVAPATTGSITIPKELLAQLDPGTATVSVRLDIPFARDQSIRLQEKNGNTLVLVTTSVSADTRAADIQ